MTQTGNSAKKKPILQKPGCLVGFAFGFIGLFGLIIIGLFLAGYSWYQIKTGDIDSLGAQAPGIEEAVDELPGEESQEEAIQPDGSACNAIQHLEITYTQPEHEEYEDGTKTCEYVGTITNTYGESVWVLVNEHKYNASEGTNHYEWTWGERAKASGFSGAYPAYFTVYNDKDYKGPGGKIPEEIAAIYKTDECTSLKEDLTYLEEIAVPMEVYCP